MSKTKTDMMLNGICMVCENKNTLCTHIGQVKDDCPFIQKAISTKITNADRIRSMTDEELAEFLRRTIWNEGSDLFDCDDFACDNACWKCEMYLEWLQSEAE